MSQKLIIGQIIHRWEIINPSIPSPTTLKNKRPFALCKGYTTNSSNSQYYKDNCEFVYNGLDRVNNDFPHNLDNCVPCCYYCNFAKSDLTQLEFYTWITKIHNYLFENEKIYDILEYLKNKNPIDNLINNLTIIKPVQAPFLCSAKSIYLGYNDEDISFEEFLMISQENCFYCGTVPGNKKRTFNKNSSRNFIDRCEFVYNGLDRVDSGKGHSKENCVPCCAQCNQSKNDMSIEEFVAWIKNLGVKWSYS